MKKALAFDIGGTKIYSTVIDETGKIVSEIDKFSTPKTLDEIKSMTALEQLDYVKKYLLLQKRNNKIIRDDGVKGD